MREQLRHAILCCALAYLVACASQPKPEHAVTASNQPMDAARTAPLLEGLGDLHWPISTDSELAQRYFDQALTLAYGFNHLEAERSFREAARLDDNCAICFWGAALVLGPNINDPVPTPEREVQAFETLSEAVARLEYADDKERALIEALQTRYAATPPPDRSSLDRAYAEAMRSVASRFPDDVQVQTLFAEAMMDTMPWAYWTEDAQPKPLTQEVFDTLDFVLERDPDHPGANHFYIHAVEQEQPERGVKPADNLRRVVPGAGHLVHMPSHIYIRVGRYHDGSLANELAIEADNDYVTQCRAQGIYPVAYVPHNHHFLWATTTMEGRSADALAAARHTAEHVDRSLIREPDMGMLQHFSAIPYYALVRFGMWEEILLEPAPDADLEIAAARKDIKKAVTRLRKAIAIEDGLIYGEPPDWFYPVRHNLGAILLEAGRPRAAEKVYRADLARFPDNGWSLFGLAESLRAQGKRKEADEVQRRFEIAWEHADVEITASRF